MIPEIREASWRCASLLAPSVGCQLDLPPIRLPAAFFAIGCSRQWVTLFLSKTTETDKRNDRFQSLFVCFVYFVVYLICRFKVYWHGFKYVLNRRGFPNTLAG